MENSVIIKTEIEVYAQRLTNQFVINNERIESEIEKGIKKAFENYDFESVVEASIRRCIDEAIRSSTDWGKIREAVRKKTDSIVDTYIESQIQQFKIDFTNSKAQTNG